jgi:hypothetical protein
LPKRLSEIGLVFLSYCDRALIEHGIFIEIANAIIFSFRLQAGAGEQVAPKEHGHLRTYRDMQ